jgi:hypothetical protein
MDGRLFLNDENSFLLCAIATNVVVVHYHVVFRVKNAALHRDFCSSFLLAKKLLSLLSIYPLVLVFKLGCCCCFVCLAMETDCHGLFNPFGAAHHEKLQQWCMILEASIALFQPNKACFSILNICASISCCCRFCLASNKGSLSWLNFNAHGHIVKMAPPLHMNFHVTEIHFQPNQSMKALYLYLFDPCIEFGGLESISSSFKNG